MNLKPRSVPELIFGLTLLCGGGTLWLFHEGNARSDRLKPATEIPQQELALKDGLWFRHGDNLPFTGWMVDYYPGGELRSRSQISKGLLNGVLETWYTNRQIELREHFKKGVSDGFRERWHENGKKWSQALIVAGKVSGTFRSWHDNGQLSEQIEMKQGQAEGVAWAYYPSGFVKAETTVQDGHAFARKVWHDGEQKAAP